ncbi:MAG: wax ester/triacylglycerol synthase family O-acyltransferase [Acidobacteria bacterium]|nr:wax ester/triacylglycerol synthase family O-acyltransferase [Acidobacteriota bacterium]
MKQLSGLDASFLVLETPEAPMHIGAVALLDPSSRGGALSFDEFRTFLAERLAAAPIFRQRLVDDPTGIGKPYWIDDPDFDLDHHLERAEVPEPGGWRQLRALMEWEFSQPLDRARPLWQLTFAEGLGELELATGERLPAGAIALLTKVHHAAIDGLSGAEILAALFDISPDGRLEGLPQDWRPPPPPGTLELLGRAGRNLAAKPFEVAETVRHTLTGAIRAGATWAVGRVEPPPSLFTAPRSRLNAPITRERTWDGVVLPLSGIKAIKDAVPGTTVNDVVLAVCSGALRDYLEERGELPDEPLVAMAPVSVREAHEKSDLGNRVSAMLVSLATEIADPVERLRSIHRGTHRSKAYQRAVGADTLTDYTRFLPFTFAGLATRLYSRMHLSRYHRPIFNLVITNVPGPQVPLYLAGARLMAHVGAGPIFDGMGMILVIFSYDGGLAIGVTSCRSILPDPDRFCALLEGSFAELGAAVRDRSAEGHQTP